MKKIVIINIGSHFGGTEIYCIELMEKLNQEKYDISMCVRTGTKLEFEILNRRNKNSNILRMDISLKTISNEIKKLKDFCKEADLIHCNGVNSSIVAVLATKSTRNVKRIVTIHGDVEMDRMEKNWLVRKSFAFIEKSLSKYFHYYIAVSNDIRDRMIKKGIPSYKIETVYNGVEESLVERLEQINEKKLNKIYVCAVGRLERVKGYDVLIKAIQDYVKKYGDNIKCDIFGEGKEFSTLEKNIINNNLSNYVFLKGYKDNVCKFITQYDIFIQPSRYETFGKAVAEVMLMNVPIIASKIGGLQELIEDGKSGILIKVGNYEGISEAIHYLYNNPDLKKIMEKNACSRVKFLFSLKKTLLETESVYDKLLVQR